MKSLITIGLMISSLFAISASGQQFTIQQVILQDDKTGDHLAFAIATGEYKFESCKGSFAISGVGAVSVTGCKVVLKDITDTRRVLAEVDLCERAGKADVAVADVAVAGVRLTSANDLSFDEFVIADTQTADSAFDCAPKPVDFK